MSKPDLYRLVMDAVTPRLDEFYQEYFPDITFNKKGESSPQHCPHPEHTDEHPSFQVNIEKGGSTTCWSCKKANNSNAIGFFALVNGIKSLDAAAERMYEKYVRKNDLVPSHTITAYQSAIKANGKVKKYLANRGITIKEILNWHIGWDEETHRVTLPIPDAYCGYMDCRKISITGAKPKNIPFKAGLGDKSRFFPIFALEQERIYICEGEWDTVLLRKHGYNAFTAGGTNSLRKEHAYLFDDKEVVICYDNDDAGIAAAHQLSKELTPYAKEVKILYIPVPDGDITDYFMDYGGTTEGFQKMVNKLFPVEQEEPEEIIIDEIEEDVDLSKSLSSELYGKPAVLVATITGEGQKVYNIPSRVRLQCDGRSGGDKCGRCEMFATDLERVSTYTEGHKINLQVVDCSDKSMDTFIRTVEDLPAKCRIDVETLVSRGIRQVILASPTTKKRQNAINYSKIIAWNMGDRLEHNKTYRLHGYITHLPRTQEMTFVITKAVPEFKDYQQFTPPAKDERDRLKNLFGPKQKTGEAIKEKILDLAHILAHNYTKVYERPETHLTELLTRYSILEMQVEDSVINSYIQTIVIGDTNTGKDKVYLDLQKLFDCGRVISGQSVSEAGMIASCVDQVFNWGAMVTADGRMVTINEASQARHIIPRLKAIRDGMADYNKAGVQQQTTARVRLSMMANAPKGSLNQYSQGVISLIELFEDPADVSRFTFACFLRKGDVADEILNREKPPPVETRITDADWRTTNMNAWWLTADRVVHDEATMEMCYDRALKLSKKYSSTIPLVQNTTIRFDLMRIAGAMAALTYNMDKEGQNLLITPAYVDAAYLFLQDMYDSPACRYNQFSEVEHKKNVIANEEEVWNSVFSPEEKQGYLAHTITELEMCNELTKDRIEEIFQDCGGEYDAKTILKILLRNRCLQKQGRLYVYTPAFVEYINRIKVVKLKKKATKQRGVFG